MNIVLGITGSIAAYKACQLIRLFVKAGCEVQVVITPSGKEFITPVTLSALTSKPVVSEFFSGRDGSWHSHVDLGLWADAFVVAPATASTLSKMACGVADNMLLTTYLSMKAPVFVAPAMDLDMYAHPATQRALATLRSDGCTIIEPAVGELASHLVGKGRMEEPERIFDAVMSALEARGTLSGKRVVVTAGPTREKIDPVRYVSNYSTGKMGYAIASELARRGAEVRLISGPVSLPTPAGHVERTDVESAGEMLRATVDAFADADAAVLCAAVADYAPAHAEAEKIKSKATELTLKLSATADIAATLGRMKRSGQRLVGFALETCNEEANAKAKLDAKRLDFIVLNSLRDAGAGFGVDTNKVTIISRDSSEKLPLMSKQEVARAIVDRLCSVL